MPWDRVGSGKPEFSTYESGFRRESDSPLEGEGFELSVPRHGELSWRAVSLDIPRGMRHGGRRRG